MIAAALPQVATDVRSAVNEGEVAGVADVGAARAPALQGAQGKCRGHVFNEPGVGFPDGPGQVLLPYLFGCDKPGVG